MKTLADVKRRVKVGMVLQCEHHLRPAISGPRPIVKVQTNAIAYTFIDPKTGAETGWTWWPKAKDVVVDGDRVSFLDPGVPGGVAFTYVFPADEMVTKCENCVYPFGPLCPRCGRPRSQTPELKAAV